MELKNIIRVFLGVAAILCIPAIGNQVSEGWQWDAMDFVFSGVLLSCVGLTFEYFRSQSTSLVQKFAWAGAIGTGLLLLWVNLAVGFIGEDNPGNILYLGVLVLGFMSSIIGTFKPKNMERAMYITAAAQFIVPIVAYSLWPDDFTPGITRVLLLNTIFTLFWVITALLFRQSTLDSKYSNPT